MSRLSTRLAAFLAFFAFAAHSTVDSLHGNCRTIETVIASPIHGTPLLETIGADYRIAEQRLNYEAASATLAPSTPKGRSIIVARGGRQNSTNKQMNINNFAKHVDDSIREAWLCRIGYHDQPLTKAEIAALNEIIHGTGVVNLVLKLSDLFRKDPINLDEAEKLINCIEGLGLRPASDHEGFELQFNSVLDRTLSKQVSAHRGLSRLHVYVNAPDLATSETAAA